ncbi:BNR repeat-containing protein [Labilibaculum sp. K2S]|uniref:BNR repeat-containing protein n=1 Tax=Labilibaculum sp. K2S TaxID=3056386 RepID=UPI0025A379F5|nr:BNR repeat-containing protein [Labilibaculum sp. K2S]MDM8159874.1 BNR repeat-containing protein [Labilibaculum sp. K2S]
MFRYYISLLSVFLLLTSCNICAQKVIPVSKGWSENSVNAVVFRQNSLVTQNGIQFIAYYNSEGFLELGKRKSKSDQFTTYTTSYKGNVNDAHNCISIMLDGDGYLHVAWDLHGNPLRYAKSIKPYSLQLGPEKEMTGSNETNVTYPQFFRMPNGNLIFMFRDGQSGKGNLAMNSYDRKTKTWVQIQSNLIDGEGQRNAYWQACVDSQGDIHVSWVWRESPDVASNHDLCYARSKDGGISWENSQGQTYSLPITATTAEYASHIPQNSELINQTSMTTDERGQPVIASYWREQNSDIPQYHIVSCTNGKWNTINLNFRKTPFSLKGAGTKRIPISRPQILAKTKHKTSTFYLIFRDEERGAKVSMAIGNTSEQGNWKVVDLTDFSVGSWEPSFDTELWKNKGIINLFVQKVEQIDGEGKADYEPQMVNVLEVKKIERYLKCDSVPVKLRK